MLFSDEDLIAYLLGDASDELTQRLQQRLPIDEDLLQRLTSLRLLLGQLNSTTCIFEPPADLVDTTLHCIDLVEQPPSPRYEQRTQVLGQSAGQSAGHLSGNLSLAGQTSRRTLWDSATLTVSLTLLCCLALPALVRVRFESRKAQCAWNLELTGSELVSYALNHPQGRFPHVALEGPLAFAGVYAIHLREAGGQIPSSQLLCPSLPASQSTADHQLVVREESGRNPAVRLTAANIASFSELHNLAQDELRLVQQTVGGNYAYNLGISEKGSPRAPKYAGRSQFAILADAPALSADSLRTSDLHTASTHTTAMHMASRRPVADRLAQFVAHEGQGINVFYEDGHVGFVSIASLRALFLSNSDVPDNPFENQLGAYELGVHPLDASLAPSHFPPLSR